MGIQKLCLSESNGNEWGRCLLAIKKQASDDLLCFWMRRPEASERRGEEKPVTCTGCQQSANLPNSVKFVWTVISFWPSKKTLGKVARWSNASDRLLNRRCSVEGYPCHRNVVWLVSGHRLPESWQIICEDPNADIGEDG
jgi:hypothetical protein